MPSLNITTSHVRESQKVPWRKAAYLHERRTHSLSDPLASSSQFSGRATWATKRLIRWRESFGPERTLYQQWLEQTALSEQELLWLLTEDEQELAQRLTTLPAWTDLFFEIIDQEESAERLSDEFLASLVQFSLFKPEREDSRILLAVVEPFLSWARRCLLNDLLPLQESNTDLQLDRTQVLHALLCTLARQLLQMIERALILEFRIALQQGQCFSGDTAWDQLHTYIRMLCSREHALAFFAEYPVLARQVTLTVKQWHSSHLEMLTRLFQDWTTLKELFLPKQPPGPLQQVQSQAGDRHHGGCSVQILSFTSGAKLVYKPRSLAIDLHFQKLLQWLNAHGQQPFMRILQVLDREVYGWMEWVDTHGCSSQKELECFYLRQGANLALLYALNAIDFHLENILAAGEHPVLIDLEALFHTPADPAHSSLGAAEQLAYEHAMGSVLRTHLLPSHVLVGKEGTWLEIGGLGGAPGQVLPNHALHLNGDETSGLRFMRESITTPGSQNRPHLNGEEVDARNYLPQIIEGFASTYRLLLRYRQELLAADGPLSHFQNDRCRAVLRATSSYGQLLFACDHPYVLRDDLDRERLLNHLWQVVSERTSMAAVIASEQADLREGTIPYFTARVDSCDLWTSTGERIPHFFAQSGWTSVQKRWQQMSEPDLAHQIWFIRASFTALSSETDLPINASLAIIKSSPEGVHPASREALLLAACQIGDRLCQLALQKGKEASWLGVGQPDTRHWTLTVADLSLYNGLPGIILALAYLGKMTEIRRYSDLARAGYVTLNKQIQQRGPSLTNVGFFSGWGGIIATLTSLALLWEDETLLEEASRIVADLPPLIAQDEAFDLINGSAGCSMGLCCLAQVAPSESIDAILRLCGEHLAAKALPASEGIGWPVFKGEPPLTGLAHGSAGIGWALLEIMRQTGEKRFGELVQGALAYERSLFSSEDRNWRDLRSTGSAFMTAWCHGAAGIGLSRLHMLPEMGSDTLHAEIQIALETTMMNGFGSNHSLCHGDLGNLEVLYQAQRLLPEPHWKEAYELSKASVFARGQHMGWQCGTPQKVETPGLMLGLAGISLQLLRLAEPECVPSFLSMGCLSPSSIER